LDQAAGDEPPTEEWQWWRIQRTGTTIRAKWWADGDNEPGWLVSASDTSLTAGQVGLVLFSGALQWCTYFAVGTGGAEAPMPSAVAKDASDSGTGSDSAAVTVQVPQEAEDSAEGSDSAIAGQPQESDDEGETDESVALVAALGVAD